MPTVSSAYGIDGNRTLVIMDASCRRQQCRRDLKAQRPNYERKSFGSADTFRRCPRRGVPSKLLDDALPPDAEVLPRSRRAGYSQRWIAQPCGSCRARYC